MSWIDKYFPSGAPSSLAVTGTGFVHVTGNVTDAAARAVNLASSGAGGDTSGVLPVSSGGTGLSTVGAAGSVLTVSGGVPAWVAPAAPVRAAVALSASGTLNPQVDTDYYVITSTLAITVTLASTIPDGVKVTFYDESQNWVTHNFSAIDQGGYTFRNPWNVGGADVATLVMGGAGDAVNGQSFSLKKVAAVSKWLS